MFTTRLNLIYLALLVAALLALLLTPSAEPVSSKFAEAEYRSELWPAQSAAVYTRFLNTPEKPPSVHAASVTQLDNGDVLAVWFGGSREGAADVAIYSRRYRADINKWTPPIVITDRERTARELGRHIRKLGNPVIYTDAQGGVWLYYVTVSLGGWAGSSITVKYSDNNGRRWTPAQRLVTSPFLNISTLVKGSPIRMDNGQLVLPVYHEFITKFGELLHLDEQGRLLYKTRMTNGPKALQPWVVAGSEDRAVAFYRRAGNAPPRVLKNETLNGGASWTRLRATEEFNPGSAVSVIRTHDGSLLMAYNPMKGNRYKLALARSEDGETWEQLRMLESGTGENEYSYPYLARGNTGDYHLVYTWNRELIRYLRFNDAWLLQEQEETEE
jgi:predicted neuraminidase